LQSNSDQQYQTRSGLAQVALHRQQRQAVKEVDKLILPLFHLAGKNDGWMNKVPSKIEQVNENPNFVCMCSQPTACVMPRRKLPGYWWVGRDSPSKREKPKAQKNA
jgi:hypothetical protein